jgi:hypothetical protein
MKFSKEEIQRVLDENDGKLKNTSDALGVPYPTLRYNVVKYGLKFKNINAPIDTSRLQQLYDHHQSLSKVAKEIGCSKNGVREAMKRLNLNINELIVHTCNEEFFSEINERSLYWAGFIAADGCVLDTKTRNGLSLALTLSDKSHLELFKEHLEATNPIGEYIVKASKPQWNDTKKAELKITSLKIFTDLAKFNIVPRKSKIYTFPEWLAKHPQVHHFMRGYFDGDGSWYVGSSKITDQIFFSLRGTTEFLEVYRSILERECKIQKREKPIRMNCGIGVLEYGGNGVSIKIRDFLYKEASICLGRKHEIVKDITVIKHLQVTPELLINMMKQFGEQKAIAKELGCSGPSITRYVNKFGIQEQMKLAKASWLTNPKNPN